MPLSLWTPPPELPPAVCGPAFLRDGAGVYVRPVQPTDRELVASFVRQVPLEDLELRYFAAIRPGVAEAEIIAPASPEERLCLLVLGDRSDRLGVLGVGEYVRAGPALPVAEVAFLVDPAVRERGVATLLLARLARAARGFGIVRFVARVRPDNPEMLEVFRGSGLALTEDRREDEVDVVVPLFPATAAAAAPRPASVPGVRAR